MNPSDSSPVFRSDLEILAQPAPGQPDRHLIKDPRSGRIIELSAKDLFLCRQMDGATDLAAIAARFRDTFQLAIRPEQVAALAESLRAEGFLANSAVETRTWERMKPLPLPFDRWLPALARALGPLAGWPLLSLQLVLLIPAAVLLVQHAPLIGYYLFDLLTHLEIAGAAGFSSIFTIGSVIQIAVFFTLIPFLREIAKGVAACHFGVRVPDVRYGWFMRFIPRCTAALHGIVRLEKGEQIRVLAAGLRLELIAFALGLLGTALFLDSNPVNDLSRNLAIGAALRFLLTANPLGEGDGGAIAGLLVDEPDLHRRSVRAFRAWLFRRPMPEPLNDRRRRNVIVWGALSDLAVQGITVALLALLGYLLVQWMGGVGAVLSLLLVLLKYEDSLRASWRRSTGTVMARSEQTSRKSFWLRTLLVVVVLTVIALIPYPYEVSGEFRTQPVAQREVRAEVTALIEAIPVVEGGEGKAGDVIAQLSTRLLEKDIELNRAALRKETEHLRAMEAGARPEDIAQLEQAVKSIETKLRFSEENLRRSADLFEKSHISPQEYQNVLQVRDLDIETLESARLALASARAGVRKEEIEAQRAVVDSLTIALKHLEDDLARTTIRSPIDGRVVTMYIQGRVGQQAVPGDVIAVVEDTSRAIVRIALPEPYSGVVGVGSSVRIRPWAYANRSFTGTVSTVLPIVIDKNRDMMQQASIEQERGMVRNLNMPEERIVPVLAEIDNEGIPFRSEMTGFAKIDAGWKPLGYAFLQPVIRFVTVQVWSWIP